MLMNLSALSLFALFLTSLENRFLIVKLGGLENFHTSNNRTGAFNSGYRFFSKKGFEPKKSLSWSQERIDQINDEANHGHRTIHFSNRKKSNYNEQESSDKENGSK